MATMNDGGQNSRPCSETSSGGGGGNGFMLFGVRLMEGSFRKSASMTDLAQYEQPHDSNADVAAGYASDDVVHPCRERKRGIPWTEEEHRLFLLGLQKVGKGDWRGISRNFVKTRTPTQVASHAQKYFLRRSNHNRRRRRSSLFDITTDAYVGSSVEEHNVHHYEIPTPPTLQPPQLTNNLEGFPLSTFPVTLNPVLPTSPANTSPDNLTLGPINQAKMNSPNLIRPLPIPIPPSSKMADLNLNLTTGTDADYPLPLSLNLSTSSSSNEQSAATRHSSAFQAVSGSFNSSSGDSIISVA